MSNSDRQFVYDGPVPKANKAIGVMPVPDDEPDALHLLRIWIEGLKERPVTTQLALALVQLLEADKIRYGPVLVGDAEDMVFTAQGADADAKWLLRNVGDRDAWKLASLVAAGKLYLKLGLVHGHRNIVFILSNQSAERMRRQGIKLSR